MPYPRVEPVDHALMMKQRYKGHNSICEKLREIYILTDDEEIKLRCRICVAMAKKMHDRLKWYKTMMEAKEAQKPVG